jgi:hypothetical protein
MTDLLLRRVSDSRPGAEAPDDYDVIGADGLIIGRIFKATQAPVGTPWSWALALATTRSTSRNGYEPTREAAMAAFAKSW